MAIGERIRFIRNLKGMTQKYLGIKAGFPERTADIRMAQYESGTRSPKADMAKSIAEVLEVSPMALNVPDINSEQGIMHTLFALEDLYGLKPTLTEKEIHITLSENSNAYNDSLVTMLKAWAEMSSKYKTGEITKEAYDEWRYNYPKFDDSFIKIPSQEFSDAMVEAFKDRLKPD